MKFGKTIQKRQLEIPEYAASFVDYKALKKLIKTLSATPVLPAQSHGVQDVQDPQASLQANKASFFFRLERELEKVNTFYLQKEAELRLRLTSLLDQKTSMQARQPPASKLSSRYIALEEGFRQFSSDLAKLQQFIEINQTAFSKILKKWDKASKQETKVIFLSRAVEVQPCFNRDVISELSDQATTNLLDFAAWAEGEKMHYILTNGDSEVVRPASQDEVDFDTQVFQAIAAGNLTVIQDWTARVGNLPDARQRITKAFLSSAEEAPEMALQLLLQTGQVDLNEIDEINQRNILHRAAISGRQVLLQIGIAGHVDVHAVDVYGRIPLHYACIRGSVDMVQALLAAGPDTVDTRDHDNFTPLIHAIVHSNLAVTQALLSANAKIDRLTEADHIPLNLACQHGSIDIVQELLRRKPQILPDAEGLYPQHLVARSAKSSPQLLLLLREYGLDLNQPDKLYQWTPIFHAASEGNVAVLQALLGCGVDPSILDEKGLSALYYATWEGHLDCMKLLAAQTDSILGKRKESQRTPQIPTLPPSRTPHAKAKEAIDIPPLILPSPIIPVRRYGHNFLESKTFVIINFGNLGYEAIQFYEENKYPAARLTISSKSSDLIPQNLLLPIQDDYKIISFQIDNVDTFTIEFDVYPTFGTRVIARAVASSKVFTEGTSSSGKWHLELLDPRLRAIGRVSFNFQVIKPYSGIPLEITHFAVYWKETDQKPHNASLITGSSLSGDYCRLYVQMTRDGVAILSPTWKLSTGVLQVPVNRLTHAEYLELGKLRDAPDTSGALDRLTSLLQESTSAAALPDIHELFANASMTLQEALNILPLEIHVELHVMFPSLKEETELGLGPTPNINTFADRLLTVVFEHARAMREKTDGYLRSIVFSSNNQDVCTALNWKQPNYPVLLCNSLEQSIEVSGVKSIPGLGRTTFSIKEAVQLAKNNNLMGIICSSKLLDLAPKISESIKTAGLVLISDVSADPESESARQQLGPPNDGVDGIFRSNGVLRFHDSINM
ncbi:uncharacterized protein PV09_03715 [Verruconis gallopava]|uniref:SPX domain-containing protein n=1 Tax=Verruconis gallopava TaxID=253628 RepID=A0A0D2B1F5_9PEZI|nr:uncharacterized protein PV09_03715 [Verruconis gallopava]KIW05164.1 hypothetical protein PV09_03715 [Verruconis gallopava]